MTLDERRMTLEDVKIDPAKAIKDLHRYQSCHQPSGHELTATDGVHMPSDIFVALTVLAQAIHEGTRWNKKARIVLEYDPDKEKMSVVTFMESDALSQALEGGAERDAG